MTTKAVLSRAFAALALAILVAMPAFAADRFPTRPVRIVVNTAPGGLNDTTARLVAQKMSDALRQPVVVENRGGAGGLLGIRAVKAAPADGYTLLSTAGTIAIQQSVMAEPGYDLARDFVPVGPMARAPFVVVVGRDQPDRTLAELMNRARANPNSLSYASAGIGTTTHIVAALFVQRAGLQLLHVPYRGNGAALPDVAGGRVDLIFEGYTSGVSSIREGVLRALAVTSEARLPGLQDVPTIAEQGVPGFSYYGYLGLLMPAGTPREVVQRLSGSLRRAMSDQELRERLRQGGSEAMDMSPEEFSEFLRRDVLEMARLVTELGLLRSQ